MPIARHGSGFRASLAALRSQVHPVFMLPPIAASWFGSVLAGRFSPAVGALHVLAIFFAVYTAHVKDGYVDFHVRGEDDDHPMTATGCRLALAGSSLAFFACLVGLWIAVDRRAALLTLPTWLIAYHHAPQLDTNPLTATTGYPTGIALAIVGGYYVQTTSLSVRTVAFAFVFLVVLSGVKIVDDEQDYEYDRSIEKRTVAVALGPRRARTAAYGLLFVGTAIVVVLSGSDLFPVGAALAAVAFAAVATVARRGDAEIATMLLVRGAYVFLALLFVAVWFRPFE